MRQCVVKGCLENACCFGYCGEHFTDDVKKNIRSKPRKKKVVLSGVQYEQIRQLLVHCIEEGSIIEKKLRGDSLYLGGRGPITPLLAQKQCEDYADATMLAVRNIIEGTK